MREEAWLSDEATPPITLNKWGASREEVPEVQSHYYIRTCWIYNLCGTMQIYKNQITDIGPKHGTKKIYTDLCRSNPINFDQ